MNVTESPCSKGIPGRDELVARAAALQPLLRDHAVEMDAQRRLTDEVVGALVDAGVFRMRRSKRLGGYETDLHVVTEVIETIGAADVSAAWLVALEAVSNWLVGRTSKRAQEEVFGADPDAHVSGSDHPGLGRRVKGGVRVSGRWPYASGSLHATWASLAARVTDDAGVLIDTVIGLVPVSQVTQEDTWHTTGMRGTGSNTWIAEDVFIPDHLLVSMPALGAGTWPIPTHEPVYHVPFAPLAVLMLMAPLLGAGRAVLDFVVEKAPTKGIHHRFSRQTDSVGVQVQVAEAALKLKTARLHAYDIADTLDASAADRGELDSGSCARIRVQATYAAQQIVDAINALITVHGAGSFALSNPLQQFWRDANTAARHVGLNSFIAYEIYGKALLGVQEPLGPAAQ
jgi:3-hydroxy-9,10-secoandrosta-1,3,5(10)-triene-9,17-dione monooxygenase